MSPRLRRRTAVRAVLLVGILLVYGGVAASSAAAAKPCRSSCRDTVPPQVTIGAPLAGASLSGSVSVSGTSSDNVSVASVSVAIDGGAWHSATGTGSWSWTWTTSTVANGSHTITARASDAAGNSTVTSEAVTVANPVPDSTPPVVSVSAPSAGATVSGTVAVSGAASDNVAVASVAVAVDGGGWQSAAGTTSWSLSWNSTGVSDGSHTLAVRATDTSGNASTTSLSVTTSNAPPPPPPPGNPPATQGSWVSPEGVTIDVNSAGNWTIAQVYSILTANALDLSAVGQHLTIEVQDQYTSQTQTSATFYGGKYTNVASTMWLQGVNSSFASRPDDTLTHEYGHAWSNYWFYVGHQGNWSSYESARWTTSDGSLTLATDSRTGSTYSWQVTEIIADDYRLLFGSSLAISERPTHLNPQIPDPRNVPGLSTFLLNSWRTA